MTQAGIPPFDRFLEGHRAVVYRFLMVAVGPAAADDVFQDTFLSALRAYPRLTDPGHLERWILRIASRKAIDHHRRRARAAIPMAETPERPALIPADTGIDPTDGVWRAVRKLPPRQRIAVVHRHLLDRPYDEIGELMGCSAQTARAHVHLGTKRLRELMT